METLKKSTADETSTKGKKSKAAGGQKEMLLPIEGKEPAAKQAASPKGSRRKEKRGQF